MLPINKGSKKMTNVILLAVSVVLLLVVSACAPEVRTETKIVTVEVPDEDVAQQLADAKVQIEQLNAALLLAITATNKCEKRKHHARR